MVFQAAFDMALSLLFAIVYNITVLCLFAILGIFAYQRGTALLNSFIRSATPRLNSFFRSINPFDMARTLNESVPDHTNNRPTGFRSSVAPQPVHPRHRSQSQTRPQCRRLIIPPHILKAAAYSQSTFYARPPQNTPCNNLTGKLSTLAVDFALSIDSISTPRCSGVADLFVTSPHKATPPAPPYKYRPKPLGGRIRLTKDLIDPKYRFQIPASHQPQRQHQRQPSSHPPPQKHVHFEYADRTVAEIHTYEAEYDGLEYAPTHTHACSPHIRGASKIFATFTSQTGRRTFLERQDGIYDEPLGMGKYGSKREGGSHLKRSMRWGNTWGICCPRPAGFRPRFADEEEEEEDY